jgi:DNA-binding transcriptional LysR family regulator
MDKLSSIRAFVAVAETGHFSLASGRLGLSRAMASKLVLDLEAQLGLRLLNRTTRSVSLTEQGATYLERCRDILAALDQADAEITSLAAEPAGRLRVTAPVSLGLSHIAPQVSAFVARHPRVEVELVLNDRVVDLVEDGFDLAVRVGLLADSSLIARRIGATRLMVCASPAYLAAHGRPKTPAELTAHHCLLYSYASDGASWTFLGANGEETARVSGPVLCNSGEALCRMAADGSGIIRQPDFIAEPYLKSGALEPLLSDYSSPSAGVYTVHSSRRHVPPKVRAFIDQLASAFESQNLSTESPA